MVWHDHKFVQGGAWEMFRNYHPAFSNQMTECAGHKATVRNAPKDTVPLMRANSDEIRARQCVVAILQPNRPAIPSGLGFRNWLHLVGAQHCCALRAL